MSSTLATSLAERRRVLVQSLAVAIVVTGIVAACQMVASVLTGSVGIRAAALDRMIDLSVHMAALVGVWAATRPPDPKHPYGYERYETLTSMAIGMFLLVTVALVVRSSVGRLQDPEVVQQPLLGIVVMAPASAASFWLTWFLSRQSARFKSDVLLTESSHAWADGLTNAAVMGGIICSEADFVRVDPAIGLAVSGLIGLRAARIVLGAADRLTDAALVDVGQIVEVATRIPGVVDCHAVRSRGGSGRIRIDLHIHVDPELSVRRAHGVSRQVEATIKEQVPGVAEVLVHIGAAGAPG